MSDDRTTDPNQPTPDSGASATGPETTASPSGYPVAPPFPASGETASPSGAPSYGAPSYGAPSYGAPSSGAPSHDAPSYPAPSSGAPSYDPSSSGSAAAAYGTGDSTYGAPAYGSPAPGTSSYGAATPSAYGQGDAAYASGGYGYAMPARTNTLAIVSLIASIVGVFVLPVIGQIVGIVTGHMSLSQIKARAEKGRGLAVAGLIVGYVTLALGVLLLVFFIILIQAAIGETSSGYGV
ncbi:DUF4190 domain-containing protein [Microbacterium sp. HMWF026]|uniref:DUF4190 domain-containing protein n=1 Tax=Microbacterium sp. HMWF026 TaxID=2056861 RepID=UPI0015E7F98C|nr:DUF4190 domain-containing protein [Microbacterium sp. HMWF026]